MTWLQMFLSNMRYLLIGMLFSLPVLAESVYTEDGSLMIIDSSEETVMFINESGEVQVEVGVSQDDPTFVYGNDKLTVCQPTGQGGICY